MRTTLRASPGSACVIGNTAARARGSPPAPGLSQGCGTSTAWTSAEPQAVEYRPNIRKKSGILEGSRDEGRSVALCLAFSPPVVACRRDDDRDVGMIEMGLRGQFQAVVLVETKIGDQQVRRHQREQRLSLNKGAG